MRAALLTFILLNAFLITQSSAVENRADDTPDNPKNIIMIIGDGMGPAYTTAFRYLHDDPSTIDVEKTVFDRHLIGLSSTYPAAVSGYVTDSAASATALASGVKTYNGAIGVSLDKQPLNSVVTFAKQAGKKTGVVVTSQVNHATPASFLTHNEDRNNYDAIADSFFNNMQSSKYQFDVLFGGGWKYFRRKDRDLVEEFKKIGFQYADSYSQLNSLRTGTPALGLFADVGLPWALDDSEPNRLLKMTQTAIELLENESGFFMLIEASQIDWAGHANDITAAMGEMYDLAKTLEFLEVYVQKNPNTLVLVTADHSTGGLTIGANNKYEWTPDILRTMKHTPSNIAKLLNQTQMSKQDLNDLLNFTLTAEEYSKLQQIKASSEKQAVSKIDSMNSRESGLYSTLKKIIDTRTNTGWTTGGHTADDVPVLAFGSQYEVFIGHNDNTDLAKKVFNLLGKK